MYQSHVKCSMSSIADPDYNGVVHSFQFRFDHHNKEVKLAEIPGKVKDKVKRVISGHRKIDRERLVEEDDDDDFKHRRLSGQDTGGVVDGGYQDLDQGQGNGSESWSR